MSLVGAAVAIAILTGVPIGIAITGSRKTADAVLYVASIVITIPSIALFGLLIPPLSLIGQGIGYLPALIALVLYSQLPIIRNTYTAITNVDPALREAARGMGMTTFQRLREVEIPIAVPVIVSGVRNAVVHGLERRGGLRDQLHGGLGGDAGEPGEQPVERLAVDEPHHQVGGRPIARHVADAVVVDVHDAGVVDRGHRTGLPLEARGEAGIVHAAGQQHFDGDGAGQDGVLASPHLAHAAGTETDVQPVTPRQRGPLGHHLSPANPNPANATSPQSSPTKRVCVAARSRRGHKTLWSYSSCRGVSRP